jgi:hypothetical protein
MPIAPGALAPQEPERRNRPRKEYPAVEGQVIAQFVSVKEAQQKTFDDRHLPWEQAAKDDVLRFTFIVLREDKDESKGYGRPVSIQVRKPRYIGKAAPGKNTSNAYKTLCRLLNNGKDLTDEQLRDLENLVNQLETDQPQYYLLVETTESGWVNVEKIMKRVPEGDMLEKWVQPEPEVDPRCEDDDPAIVCSVTGKPIRGWEKSDGEWMDNREWAALQNEKLGGNAFEFSDFPGQVFTPPFIGPFYRAARDALDPLVTTSKAQVVWSKAEDVPF